jgi:hypothetical protein
VTNDAKAFCYAGTWASYGPVYNSLYTTNDMPIEECQALACTYYPNIPQCPNLAQPTCQYSYVTEQRSCGENEIGSITFKREQSCPDPFGTPVDSGWFEISRECSPAPATCQISTQTRQTSCQNGYNGQIVEQQTSTCATPYSEPLWSGIWIQSSNSCVISVNNPMNVNSPVSPISPLNQEMNAAPIPTVSDAPLSPVQSLTPTATTILETTPAQETKTESSANTTDKPKGKTFVEGFGLVVSMELMNKPLQEQELQLQSAIEYSMELDYGTRRNQQHLIDLIVETDISLAFDGLVGKRVSNLRNRYLLQRFSGFD